MDEQEEMRAMPTKHEGLQSSTMSHGRPSFTGSSLVSNLPHVDRSVEMMLSGITRMHNVIFSSATCINQVFV